MSGYLTSKEMNILFPSRNLNVNLWSKEGLPNTFGKGKKEVVNFLNKRAYPETKQTMMFLR